MTLPFRRRHHDDEGAHDRARALTSRDLLEPLGEAETAWLARHLTGCAECSQDRDAYLADQMLLRSLRDNTPEPPRDLWARTSAALDREARGRRGRSIGARDRRAVPGRRRIGLPFGAAAGALIVLVVVGVSVFPPVIPPIASPGSSQVAVITPNPEPTQIIVTAGRLGWIQAAEDGQWQLILAKVEAVCPRSRPNCQQLIEEGPARTINLGSAPTGITISPMENQLVIERKAEGTAPDRILVVPLPPLTPTATPTPAITPTPVTTPSPAATPTPVDTASPLDTPTPVPPSDEPASPAPPTPVPTSTTPDGTIEIASGVTMVGEAAYSKDGLWLAFSARPSDGSAGPDLYLWSVGQPTAIAVTSNHRSYFSTWLEDRVLASSVEDVVSPAESALPTEIPTLEPTATPVDTPAAAIEAHPTSFLLDPATLVRTEISRPDVWLPVVDPTGRFVAYWSGTLTPTADGMDWRLATGQLVLDGWSAGAAEPSTEPSAEPSVEPTEAPAQQSDEPIPTVGPTLGPVGAQIPVVTGATAAFKAKFDPSGTRLAVWAGEEIDARVGRLHLIVLDPTTGAIEPDVAPLPGAPALKRFSIDEGRLAWVSPSGQDGQESAVQVLGWAADAFGEIRTVPAKDLYIVR